MRKDLIGTLPANIDKIYGAYCDEHLNIRKMELLFDTFENTIRYFGCIFLNEYLKRDFSDDKINNSIIALARPSLGIWMGFVNTYVIRNIKLGQKISYIDGFETVHESIRKNKSFKDKLYSGRFVSDNSEHKSVFDEIIMIRNGLAHGALYPDEAEASEIVEYLDYYIDIILDGYRTVFEDYHIEKCVRITEDDDYCYDITFKPIRNKEECGEEHVINSDSDDVKENALYIVGENGSFFEMNEFLVELSEADSSENYYLYDGYGNKYVVYLGTREKHYINRYFELVKKKFGDKKDLSMKWTEGAFDIVKFKDYVNKLTDFSLEIHRQSKKYNSGVYVERNIDAIVEEFMASDKTTLVVTAEAGVGKTNFLCHTAEKLSDNCAVYFFNGSDMIDAHVSNQLFKKLQDNCLDEGQFNSVEYFLAYVNDNNTEENIPLVLLVDAVNEAYDVEEILKEIDNITSLGAIYPWLKIIISIRTVSYNIFFDSVVEGMGKKFLLFSNRDRYYSIPDEKNENQYNIEIDEWNILQVMDAYDKYCKSNNMQSRGEEFLRLSPETKKLLSNPLNMNLYFEVKKHNPDTIITSERELFTEMYKSLKEKQELTRSTEQLQADIVEMMIKDQHNEIEYDRVFEASRELVRGVNNDYRLLILPPYQRLIDAGVLYEKETGDLRVFSFVYQKYLEYLIYMRIKEQNYDEFTVAEKMLESYTWKELPEAFLAYKNVMEDNFDCIQAMQVITDVARRSNFDVKALRSVYADMIENLLLKTNDYTEDLVNFLIENDFIDMAVMMVYKVYTKEVTDSAINLAMELLKHSDVLTKEQIVELKYRIALAYQKISKYEEALELFDECISLGDGDRTNVFYVEKSKTYRKLGQNDVAMRILEENFDDENEDTPYIDLAWIQKGLCYRDLKENDTALMYYLKALPISEARKDNFNVIYNELGISTIYVRKNDYKRAYEVVEKLCRNANRYGYINLLSDGMNAMANIANHEGRYEDAIRFARQGLTIWEESKYYVGQVRMYEHIINAMVGLNRPMDEIQIEIDAGNRVVPYVQERVILDGFYAAVRKTGLKNLPDE